MKSATTLQSGWNGLLFHTNKQQIILEKNIFGLTYIVTSRYNFIRA